MTDVALKEYFDRRLDDLERRMIERFQLNDVAISKAEHSMTTRLNSMNEFRDALRDQSARMATRAEMEKIDGDVRDLQRSKSNMEGRMVVIGGGISMAVTVVLWALTRLLP